MILIGLALLAFLYFSPVTPSPNQVNEENTTEDSPELTGELSPDQKLDQALQELQDGSTPPMQAIMKIRQVAQDHPENQRAQLTLGLLSLQTGQYENASMRFGNLVALDSSNGESWKYLAQAKLGAGDTVEARKDFEKALQLVDEETADRFKSEFRLYCRTWYRRITTYSTA